MFLVTFVSVMVAIIGLFAQVYTLQSTKMHNAEIGLVQTMIRWHVTASEMVKNSPPTTMPCQLTLTNGNACSTGLVGDQLATAMGYNKKSYLFMSQAFTNSGVTYLITYVDPLSVDAYTKDLILPGSTVPIGNTFSDLSQQFAKGAPNYIQWGVADSTGSNITVRTSGYGAGTLTFPTPAIPANSFGIISIVQ